MNYLQHSPVPNYLKLWSGVNMAWNIAHSLPHYWRGSLWASGLFRKTAYRNRNKRFSVGIQSMLNVANSVQDCAFVCEEAFPSLFLFLIGCSLMAVAVAKQFLTCIYIIFQWQFFYWKICKLQLQILLHGIRILWFEGGYLNFSIHSLLLLGICNSKDRNPVLSKLLDLQWYFPFLPGRSLFLWECRHHAWADLCHCKATFFVLNLQILVCKQFFVYFMIFKMLITP
jgi:hypothetical protein